MEYLVVAHSLFLILALLLNQIKALQKPVLEYKCVLAVGRFSKSTFLFVNTVVILLFLNTGLEPRECITLALRHRLNPVY